MKDSLKWLLSKFPYFLDKSNGSNFYKSSSVINEAFKEFRQDLFNTHLSHRLDKRVLLWKEQSVENDYTINFFVNLPYLKMVNVYKNDNLIYTESYEYDDEVNTFIYSHDDSSENIIPSDKYHITVETWEEYVLSKGFPENDTPVGDIYDHDESLDHFGALYDIPRKRYTYNENTNYGNTEPKYNNRLTEDDYHYMNRILGYISHMQDTPLPVLEVWKLFGIDLSKISLINRERYLCKMYSVTKHGGDTWEPYPWEHKDPMGCFWPEPVFFFVEVDNHSPVYGQSINFTYTFMNMFGEDKGKDYLIDVYLDGEQIATEVDPLSVYEFSTKDVDDSEPLVFKFVANPLDDRMDVLESDEIIITIKGCNSADWYVSMDGSDSNVGDKDHPFRTVKKAVDSVEGSRNVIVLVEGTFWITNELLVDTSMSIISCRGATIRNDTNYNFFRILQECSLYLQGITLKHKCCYMYGFDDYFLNNNRTQNPVYLRINPDFMCKPPVSIGVDNLTQRIYAHRNLTVSGVLSNAKTEESISNENIDLYEGNNLLATDTTGTNGEYSINHRVDSIGHHAYRLNHDESEKYCMGDTEFSILVEAMPGVLTARMDSEVILGDSLTVGYGLVDYYGDDIVSGTVSLMEGSTVLETVNIGEDFTYAPSVLGEHTYHLHYGGDETYNVPDTDSFTVSVRKMDTFLVCSTSEFSYDVSDNVNVTGVLTTETGAVVKNATVKLYDGSTLLYTGVTGNDGTVSVNQRFSEGYHTLKWTYDGATGLKACTSNSLMINVHDSSKIPEIKLVLSADDYEVTGDTVDLNVYATDKNDNPISTSFKLLDSSITDCDKLPSETYTTGNDGTWTGSYTNSMIEECNGVYLQAVSTVDDTVYSNTIHIMYQETGGLKLSASNLTKYQGGTEQFVARLLDNGVPVQNADLTFTFEGSSYIISTDSNGEAKLTVANNVPGVYPVTVTYNALQINRRVTILSRFISSDVTKYEKGTESYSCKVLTTTGESVGSGKTVTVELNGVTTNYTTDNNGTITVPLTGTPGEYILTASYDGVTGSNTINILSRIIASNMTAYERCNNYSAEFLTTTGEHVPDGTSVRFTINGVNYDRTTTDGFMTIPINIKHGEYPVTISYGDVTPVSKTITILKRILTTDLTMTYGDGSQFTATLVDCNGNVMSGETVDFNINGTQYSRVTDGNGQAKMNITLSPGTYAVTTAYGSLNIEGNTITVNAPASLSLTSTANKNTCIIGDTTRFTGKLTLGTSPISSETLTYTIKQGATILDTGSVTTDANGEAYVDYTSVSIGTVTCTFMFGDLNSSVNVDIVDHVYELELSADKSVIQRSETSVVSCLLNDNGVPVSGESLVYSVVHGSSTIDSGTLTTGSDGKASISYTGTGVGDVSVEVSYGTLLQKTFVIEDCDYWNDGSRVSDLEIGSNVSCTTNGDYITITTSTSGEKDVKLPVTLTGDWEFTTELAENMPLGSQMSFKVGTGQQWGAFNPNNTITVNLGSSQSFNKIVSKGMVLKITYINGTMTVYWNDEQLTSRAVTVSGKIGYYTNNGRYQYIKNIKLKPL